MCARDEPTWHHRGARDQLAYYTCVQKMNHHACAAHVCKRCPNMPVLLGEHVPTTSKVMCFCLFLFHTVMTVSLAHKLIHADKTG